MRTGRRLFLLGLILVAMWLWGGAEDPHGGAFILIAGALLTLLGAAITIAVWAFRPGPDPLRDPFGAGTDSEDPDDVRHN